MQIIAGLKKQITNNCGDTRNFWVILGLNRDVFLNQITNYTRNQSFKLTAYCYKDQATFENTESAPMPDETLTKSFRIELTVQQLATMTFLTGNDYAYEQLMLTNIFFSDAEIIYKTL
jgi:hypothetical protein